MNRLALQPSSKVTASAIAGASVAIILWVLQETTGLDVPPGVESAITVLITAAVGWMKTEFRDAGHAEEGQELPTRKSG